MTSTREPCAGGVHQRTRQRGPLGLRQLVGHPSRDDERGLARAAERGRAGAHDGGVETERGIGVARLVQRPRVRVEPEHRSRAGGDGGRRAHRAGAAAHVDHGQRDATRPRWPRGPAATRSPARRTGSASGRSRARRRPAFRRHPARGARPGRTLAARHRRTTRRAARGTPRRTAGSRGAAPRGARSRGPARPASYASKRTMSRREREALAHRRWRRCARDGRAHRGRRTPGEPVHARPDRAGAGRAARQRGHARGARRHAVPAPLHCWARAGGPAPRPHGYPASGHRGHLPRARVVDRCLRQARRGRHRGWPRDRHPATATRRHAVAWWNRWRHGEVTGRAGLRDRDPDGHQRAPQHPVAQPREGPARLRYLRARGARPHAAWRRHASRPRSPIRCPWATIETERLVRALGTATSRARRRSTASSRSTRTSARSRASPARCMPAATTRARWIASSRPARPRRRISASRSSKASALPLDHHVPRGRGRHERGRAARTRWTRDWRSPGSSPGGSSSGRRASRASTSCWTSPPTTRGWRTSCG